MIEQIRIANKAAISFALCLMIRYIVELLLNFRIHGLAVSLHERGPRTVLSKFSLSPVFSLDMLLLSLFGTVMFLAKASFAAITVEDMMSVICTDKARVESNKLRPEKVAPLRTLKVCCVPDGPETIAAIREEGLYSHLIKYQCVKCPSGPIFLPPVPSKVLLWFRSMLMKALRTDDPAHEACLRAPNRVWCCHLFRPYAPRETWSGQLVGGAKSCYSAKDEIDDPDSKPAARKKTPGLREGRGKGRGFTVPRFKEPGTGDHVRGRTTTSPKRISPKQPVVEPVFPPFPKLAPEVWELFGGGAN